MSGVEVGFASEIMCMMFANGDAEDVHLASAKFIEQVTRVEFIFS